jgi:hypothetical protein
MNRFYSKFAGYVMLLGLALVGGAIVIALGIAAWEWLT